MTWRRWGIAAVALALFAGVGLAQTPKNAFDKDPWPMAKEGPVKVFILAGQSNMQGHAALRTLEYLIYNEESAAEYQQWKDRYGDWAGSSASDCPSRCSSSRPAGADAA